MKYLPLVLVLPLIGMMAARSWGRDDETGGATAMPAAAVPATTRPGWTLTWQDEFDGPQVDQQKWQIMDRKDSFNDEKQYYRPDQVKIIEGGILRLTATNEPLDGKAYRSGLIMSKFTQAYGRFECRAKLPATQGMWPAFWLLPQPADWPHRGEIDIMEARGSNTARFGNAYHFADPNTRRHRNVGRSYRPKDAAGQPIDLAGGFHVYAVEWQPGELRFYFDNNPEPIYTVTNAQAPISDHPMGIILNLAVGGWYGGDPNETTVFPQHFDIDYVRVWQRTDGYPPATQPTTAPATPRP